jgi:hypothetical protein
MVRTTLAVAGFVGLGILAAAPAGAAPVSTVSCANPCTIEDPAYFPTALNSWLTLPDQVGAIPGTVASDLEAVPGRVIGDITGIPDRVQSDIENIRNSIPGGAD